VQPEQHKGIGLVKDMAAGAVLIVSMAAAVVGLIVFVPYLIELFH
jgi:diacylglycerol kinase (ATP)